MLQNEHIAGVQAVNGSQETNIFANASQFARILMQIDFILIKIFADRSEQQEDRKSMKNPQADWF